MLSLIRTQVKFLGYGEGDNEEVLAVVSDRINDGASKRWRDIDPAGVIDFRLPELSRRFYRVHSVVEVRYVGVGETTDRDGCI